MAVPILINDVEKAQKTKCAASGCDENIEMTYHVLPSGDLVPAFFSAIFKGKHYFLCKKHYDEWNMIVECKLLKFLEINEKGGSEI